MLVTGISTGLAKIIVTCIESIVTCVSVWIALYVSDDTFIYLNSPLLLCLCFLVTIFLLTKVIHMTLRFFQSITRNKCVF
jgi:hypothetical protein